MLLRLGPEHRRRGLGELRGERVPRLASRGLAACGHGGDEARVANGRAAAVDEFRGVRGERLEARKTSCRTCDRRGCGVAENGARTVARALAGRALGFDDGDVGTFSDEGQGGLQAREARSNDCGVHVLVFFLGKKESVIVAQSASMGLPRTYGWHILKEPLISGTSAMTEHTTAECPYPKLEAPVPRAERENDPLTETSVAERVLLDGRFIKVVEEDVVLPDGRPSRRFGLRHGGAAGMIALGADGTIVLERQWRHPLRRAFWEIPAGKLDQGEAELDCAKRELVEECGIHAARWTRLGELNNAIGYSNERIVVFLAEDLSWGTQALDEGEHLEVVRVDLKEALDMCADGRITDVKTIVGLFWLERLLASRSA